MESKTKEEIAFEHRMQMKEESARFHKRVTKLRRNFYANKKLFDLLEYGLDKFNLNYNN